MAQHYQATITRNVLHSTTHKLSDITINTPNVIIQEIRSTLRNCSALIIQITAFPTSPESTNMRKKATLADELRPDHRQRLTSEARTQNQTRNLGISRTDLREAVIKQHAKT